MGSLRGDISSEWHSEDITYLPHSIEVMVPNEINDQFYIVIGIENKSNGQCVYSSGKYFYHTGDMNDSFKNIVVKSNHETNKFINHFIFQKIIQ
jgi:hypothetical protein